MIDAPDMLLKCADLNLVDEHAGCSEVHFYQPFRIFMRGSVEWTGGTGLVGINSSDQRVELNWDEGPSPMQLTLQMVGACSLVDVVIGLKDRKFSKVWVDLNSERADESPRVFTKIIMDYHVEGEVPLKLVERVVAKSHEKYCSVSNMLTPKVEIVSNCFVHN